MEIIIFLFVAVIGIAIKANKAASRAGKAARGSWSLGEAALRRVRKERDRARLQEEELRERWTPHSDVEPPPAPEMSDEVAEAATVLEEMDMAQGVLEEPEPVVAEFVEEPAWEPDPAEETFEPDPVPEEPIPEEPIPEEPIPEEPIPEEPIPEEPIPEEPIPEEPIPEEPIPEASLPDPEPLPPVPLTEPTEVAAELFGEGLPGFEVARRFDEDHRGQRVRWRVTVDRAEPFHRDQKLGDGPGTRLVAEFVPTDPSARHLRLDVGLPAGLEGDLERGLEVEVEGTLSDCDPYLLGFSLADARLV